MNNPPRKPPRFVPTLTEVVDVTNPELTSHAAAPAADGMPAAHAPNSIVATRMSEEEAFRIEDQLLHRVLQRVDLGLDTRMRAAVSKAVQRQLETMVPQLRNEIESVLRELVVEALAQELTESTGLISTS